MDVVVNVVSWFFGAFIGSMLGTLLGMFLFDR